MQIIWHNKAKQDLDENIRYIAKQSLKNALTVLETLTSLVNSLKIFPLAYSKEPVYNKENVRFIVKWNFKIIYKVDKANNTIYILRIFNTKQQPKRIIE